METYKHIFLQVAARARARTQTQRELTKEDRSICKLFTEGKHHSINRREGINSFDRICNLHRIIEKNILFFLHNY